MEIAAVEPVRSGTFVNVPPRNRALAPCNINKPCQLPKQVRGAGEPKKAVGSRDGSTCGIYAVVFPCPFRSKLAMDCIDRI